MSHCSRYTPPSPISIINNHVIVPKSLTTHLIHGCHIKLSTGGIAGLLLDGMLLVVLEDPLGLDLLIGTLTFLLGIPQYLP